MLQAFASRNENDIGEGLAFGPSPAAFPLWANADDAPAKADADAVLADNRRRHRGSLLVFVGSLSRVAGPTK
jgi:hypothetical protein